MAERYNFKYLPLVGKLPGKSMVEQTETAINELASVVYDNVGHVGNLAEEVQTANTNASNALDKATEALETSSRVYIKQIAAVDVNDYYDSELYYIDNDGSTSIPVRDRGFLEVKTNDDKTACEQVFIADSTGTPYYRHGRITEQTLGEETTYVVTWSSWYRVATTEYVQAELQDYLPLSGGTLTGVVNGVTPPNGDNSKKLATTEFVNATAQQADWNVTDTTSKAFVKNKPINLVAIGNAPKFSLNKFSKADNGGNPVYFLMHELVQYNPDKLTIPISTVYGFNGMVFGEPRIGNGNNQFLAIVKVGLGFEYNDLYSSSGNYSPVVLKDETNNKYYWAMKINGSYQTVFMLGAFTANPLNTVISAVDRAGTLPEGWRLVHTALPYPFDNTTAAPTGVVQAFAGSTTPQGWLLCDGSAVSRTNYAALFAVIGTTYGAGNGSTTFNLPNLVDKFVEGSATPGTVKSAGLPNITGSIGGGSGFGGPAGNGSGIGFLRDTMINGCFQPTADKYGSETGSGGGTVPSGYPVMTANLDASRSSAIYGKSTTVQPPALTMRYIIKY